MLDVPNLREVIKEMVLFVRGKVAGASTMKFRRADQFVNVPSFPFLLYSIGGDQIEDSQSNIITQRTNQGDDTKIDKTRRELNQIPITIMAVDKIKPDIPYNIIKAAKEWFLLQVGKDFAKARGFVTRIINQSITNISNFRNTAYLPRIGFEVRLDFQSATIEELSRIDTIGISIDTGLPGDPEEKTIEIQEEIT